MGKFFKIDLSNCCNKNTFYMYIYEKKILPITNNYMLSLLTSVFMSEAYFIQNIDFFFNNFLRLL